MAERRKAPLRVVQDGEPKARPKPMSLAAAVESGTYRDILVAQRAEIAYSLPDEKGPAKAALHRQLFLIAKEIEDLDARAAKEGAIDGDLPEDEAWDGEAI